MLESLFKIFSDECADLLRPQVVGIVITTAKHVGAQDDAPLDFGTKARASSVGIEFCRILALLAVSITDTIKTRQIGTSLCGADDIIGGNGEFCVRKGDFLDFCSQVFELLDRLIYRRASLFSETVDKIFLGQTDSKALDIFAKCRGVMTDRSLNTGGILGVVSRDGFKHDGSIFDRSC